MAILLFLTKPRSAECMYRFEPYVFHEAHGGDFQTQLCHGRKSVEFMPKLQIRIALTAKLVFSDSGPYQPELLNEPSGDAAERGDTKNR